ncbi:MAG: DNA-binding protein [Acidimicrobiales bacterium]|nr:DNA-binding protein [Acidimicrobiales bacterium]
MRIEDPPPFLRVDQAQELTQLGRTQVYEQTRRFLDTDGREGIPVVRFGRSLRIPKAALLRLALVEPEPPEAGDAA